MGDACRTEICPGDGGGAGNPQDRLKLQIYPVSEGILIIYVLGWGLMLRWFVLRMGTPQ